MVVGIGSKGYRDVCIIIWDELGLIKVGLPLSPLGSVSLIHLLWRLRVLVEYALRKLWGLLSHYPGKLGLRRLKNWHHSLLAKLLLSLKLPLWLKSVSLLSRHHLAVKVLHPGPLVIEKP